MKLSYPLDNLENRLTSYVGMALEGASREDIRRMELVDDAIISIALQEELGKRVELNDLHLADEAFNNKDKYKQRINDMRKLNQ